MTEWTVDLPYQRPPLSLNDRMHWALRNTWHGQLRTDAHNLALHHKLPKGLARVGVTLHYQPRTAGRRDEINIQATLKPLIDGLVDYGLVADDDSEHVTSGTVIEATAAKGRVWLTISDLSGVDVEPQARIALGLSILQHRSFCADCQPHAEQARYALLGATVDELRELM